MISAYSVTHLPVSSLDIHILIDTHHTPIHTSDLTPCFPKLKHVGACLHTHRLNMWGLNFSLHSFNKSSSGFFRLEETYFSPRSPCHAFSTHVCGLWKWWGDWLRPSFLLLQHHTVTSSFHFCLAYHLCCVYKCPKSSTLTVFHNFYLFILLHILFLSVQSVVSLSFPLSVFMQRLLDPI